jgi:hypothetical protein
VPQLRPEHSHQRFGELLSQVNGIHQLSVDILGKPDTCQHGFEPLRLAITHQLQMINGTVSNSDGLGILVSSQMIQFFFGQIFAAVDGIHAARVGASAEAFANMDLGTNICKEPSEFWKEIVQVLGQ